MKAVALSILIVLALIPVSLQASISEDMEDPNLTLTQVIRRATDAGLSMGQIITQMLEAEQDQSSAIITTGIVYDNSKYDEIIEAAINFGIPATSVLAVAMTAAPDLSDDILNSVLEHAEDTEKNGLRALAGVLRLPRYVATPGGGSGFTSQDYTDLISDYEDALSNYETTLGQLVNADELISKISGEIAKAQEQLAILGADGTSPEDAEKAFAELDDILNGIDDSIGSYAGGQPI